MSLTLFDPLDPPGGAWPSDAGIERAYIEAVARAGVPAMVENVATRWLALRSGARVLPVTVNDGIAGESYVCLPHSAYIRYGLQELALVDVGAGAWPLRLAIRAADRPLLAAGINRIVHVDNWLLSTNLHGDWAGEDLAAIRRMLVERFPDHIPAIRSLDRWSCPALLAAAETDGWVLVPSRQVWVTDDLAVNWRRRNAFGNDRRLIRKSPLMLEDLDALAPGEAERIAELYRMLYVGKYSALNPIFTPAWIEATHRIGMIRYRGARGPDGRLMAVAGSFVRGDVLTPPVVGYDTCWPAREGLYRIASWLFMEAAAKSGLRLHGSAGAAHFKRLRGARGEIEYWAMYVGHLPRRRRAAVEGLAWILNRFAVPMMRRRGL